MEGWHHQNLILPKVRELCREQSAYLNQHFKTQEDVSSNSTSSRLLSECSKHCTELETCLLHLHTTLIERALSWISRSFRAKASLANLNLTLYASSPRSADGTASQRMQRILGEELPQLALQLQRIHNIRQYLETALCLEALVGDVEDAVFSSGNHRTGNMFTKLSTSLTSQVFILLPFFPIISECISSIISRHSCYAGFWTKAQKITQALKAMSDIEEIIVNVEKSQQQWYQLLQYVDYRVDKTLSVLRPEALAEHRALLDSLGWPPKLLTSKVESGGISRFLNPLVLMHGDEKKSYAQSFQVLCALQKLQTHRELRKFKTLGQKECDVQLWAIDELVFPIAERMEYHFLKWAEQPEFIFSRIIELSANEAWVSAMVHMLSEFLTKKVFPALAERPDWLKIWAKMELKDGWKKLKAVLKDARAWQIDNKHKVDFNVSTNAELSPEDPDDSALVRACESINAARYVESKLLEWSDDVKFFRDEDC
ncbi:hypothetical protein REPUB_Repub08aG0238900 [Reevesia pubescens]